MKTLKERIAVEQAYADGSDIVWEYLSSGEKADLMEANKDLTIFNWVCYDYRIKPKPLEFWVNIYQDGEMQMFTQEHRAINMAGSKTRTVKAVEVIEND